MLFACTNADRGSNRGLAGVHAGMPRVLLVGFLLGLLPTFHTAQDRFVHRDKLVSNRDCISVLQYWCTDCRLGHFNNHDYDTTHAIGNCPTAGADWICFGLAGSANIPRANNKS